MYRYKKFVHFFIFFIIVLLSFNINYNPFIVQDVKEFSQSITSATKINTTLYKEVEEKSVALFEAPQNAYIDKVWKKTPGRNGVRVDIEKSYEKMKKEGIYDESLLVINEIKPQTTLKDLPASPIYRGHPEKEMVAFLINVSWGTEHIPNLLKILKEHKIKATFFLEGKWAKENADFVKMIAEQGHVIGNHAYNHPDMARLSHAEIIEQIKQTNNIIKAIIGEEPKWFAPPSGSFSNQVVETAHQLKMETILWTVDTVDWRNPSVSVMMNRVMKNIHPGAMILMHPTSSVVKGLALIIEDIKQKGYKISTVDTLLNEER